MKLLEHIEEQIKHLNLSSQEFSELMIRLLDYGVINRHESQVENLLYDRYLLCEELVEDYLSVIGVRIQHNRKFCFIRIFPPGATIPGLQDDEHAPFNHGFRVRPTQQEVAAILVLRVEYEKSIREGQVDDKGCVLISQEGLAISVKNLLKRDLPDQIHERRNLFKRLRQLRLIQMASDDAVEAEDNWIRILPSITSFVSDETLVKLGQVEPENIDPKIDSETTDVL